MGFSKNKNKSNQSSESTSSQVSNSLSESYSGNQSYDFLKDAFGGAATNFNTGTSAIADLLGLNGSGGQSSAFDTFRNSGGYNFLQSEGIRGVEASGAAKGLLNSGSTLKALQDRSNNLASTFLNSYLSSLTGLAGTGLSAGQLLAGAGNVSSSKSTSSSVGTGSSRSTGQSSGGGTSFSFG